MSSAARSLDVKEIGPMKTPRGKEIFVETSKDKAKLFTLPPNRSYCGSGSKEVIINQFITLDDLFFEGLGLWVGEGGKDRSIFWKF